MISELISAVFGVVDKLLPADECELTKVRNEKLKTELAPLLQQLKINEAEAYHRSIFIAGWRPFIGWICGVALGYSFLIRPILSGFGIELAHVDTGSLYPLMMGLLGMSGLRTFEKYKQISK